MSPCPAYGRFWDGLVHTLANLTHTGLIGDFIALARGPAMFASIVLAPIGALGFMRSSNATVRSSATDASSE